MVRRHRFRCYQQDFKMVAFLRPLELQKLHLNVKSKQVSVHISGTELHKSILGGVTCMAPSCMWPSWPVDLWALASSSATSHFTDLARALLAGTEPQVHMYECVPPACLEIKGNKILTT